MTKVRSWVQSPQTQVAQLAATSTRLMDRLGQHTRPEAGPHSQGEDSQSLKMIKARSGSVKVKLKRYEIGGETCQGANEAVASLIEPTFLCSLSLGLGGCRFLFYSYIQVAAIGDCQG